MTAEELRKAFDRSFSEAPALGREELVSGLALGVGGEGYALLLSDVEALVADRPITPLPGASAEMLGLIGLRGRLVAVYDLGVLLAIPASRTSRWLALTATRPQIALAFERFEGHLHAPRADLLADRGRRLVQAVLHRRPVIDVRAIVQAVADQANKGVAP